MTGFTLVFPEGRHYPYVQGEDWRRNPIERKASPPPEEHMTETQRKEEPYDRHSRWQSTLESAETHVKRVPREGREPVAADIMSSPPVTLHPEDTLDEAWQLITTSRFRHIPIIDWDGNLVGILSDRGLLEGLKSKKDVRLVKDVMVRKVLCASPKTKVTRITKVFIVERVGSMPIINDKRELVGMVTRSDVLRLVVAMSGIQLD